MTIRYEVRGTEVFRIEEKRVNLQDDKEAAEHSRWLVANPPKKGGKKAKEQKGAK